jgi:AraC-like DNA-binding protein
VALAAPVLAWVPPGAAERLHLRAGAVGQLLGVSEDFLASTLGSGAESFALGHITDRLLAVAVPDDGRLADLRHSFTAIGREIVRPESGSWTTVAAHISLILVGMWRASGVEAMAGAARGTSSAVLQRFRSLVEMNFRDHWPIPRYADALAVSSDRLHAICMRDLKRPPLKLVHERVIREAMLLLDRSMLTVEQISDHLGFKDPAHFNRFFKAKAGAPPGTFRRGLARSTTRSDGLRSIHSYADWP